MALIPDDPQDVTKTFLDEASEQISKKRSLNGISFLLLIMIKYRNDNWSFEQFNI